MIILEKNKILLSLISIFCIISSSCNDEFGGNLRSIKNGDKKDKVLRILGRPDKIRPAYYDKEIVMFDYGISTGAPDHRAVFFDRDTVFVVRVSMGD